MPPRTDSTSLSFRGSSTLCITTALIALVFLAASTTAARAAYLTGACLGDKLKVHATLEKCESTQGAKLLLGMPADFEKCQLKFETKLNKIDLKAAGNAGAGAGFAALQAPIECRYRDNGDGTVSDFTTGLMWEKKTATVEGECVAGDTHCVNHMYTFDDAPVWANSLNGTSTDGTSVTGFAGYSDWRMPSIVELKSIWSSQSWPCGLLMRW